MNGSLVLKCVVVERRRSEGASELRAEEGGAGVEALGSQWWKRCGAEKMRGMDGLWWDRMEAQVR